MRFCIQPTRKINIDIPQAGHCYLILIPTFFYFRPTSENGSAFAAPVMSSSRGVLLKGTSIDGSTDGALDDEPNANRISSAKPKRKGYCIDYLYTLAL